MDHYHQSHLQEAEKCALDACAGNIKVVFGDFRQDSFNALHQGFYHLRDSNILGFLDYERLYPVLEWRNPVDMRLLHNLAYLFVVSMVLGDLMVQQLGRRAPDGSSLVRTIRINLLPVND